MTNTDTAHSPREVVETFHDLTEYQKASTCFWEPGDRVGEDAHGKAVSSGKEMDVAVFPVRIYRRSEG